MFTLGPYCRQIFYDIGQQHIGQQATEQFKGVMGTTQKL